MTLLADVFQAYLGPLLKKHSKELPLYWEDLEASHAASKKLLESSDNIFVSKRMEDLHMSQVMAYREAALKGLRDWAQTTCQLAPMEENDTENAFVERCVKAIAGIPSWKMPNARMVVTLEIRKRARATFAKYHPTARGDSDSNNTNSQNDDNNKDGNKKNDQVGQGEEGEKGAVDQATSAEDGEEGDEDEDGEEDGQDSEMEDGQHTTETTGGTDATNKATPKAKQSQAAAKKKKKAGGKKVVPRKKNASAKQATPNARTKKGAASNRGRRRQAGGGNANKNN